MSKFDVALGLSQAAINQISDGFYTRGKDTIYKGSISADGTTIDWQANDAPVFNFMQPTLKQAKQIVDTCDVSGKYPKLISAMAKIPELKDHFAEHMAAAANGFTMTIQNFQLSFGTSETVTVPLVARGCVTNANNVTKMDLLSVAITVQGTVNQAIVNKFVIPHMTSTLAAMLAGFKIPALAIEGLSIGATNASVVDGKIVIFGNLSGNTAAPNIDGFAMPSSNFFALLGSAALTQQVYAKIGNKSFGPSGSVDLGITTADYHATVTIQNPAAHMSGNDLQVDMGLKGSASAGMTIACSHPSVGFDLYAEPSPSVDCSLTINGNNISVHGSKCSPFATIVNATGVTKIIAPFVDPIASAIASSVTAMFSSQIISLISFGSFSIPTMPVNYSSITMTVAGTNTSINNVSGYMGVEGDIAIT